MCTPQGIIEHLGCMVFNEAIKAVTKAGKYVRQYKTNLEKLQTEMTFLEDRRKIIERKVNEANDRGEVIEEDVSHWQRDTEEMKIYIQDLVRESADEAKMNCFACSCPNIKWQYRLSKQAEGKIEDVKKLVQSSNFTCISHHKPPPPELEFPSNENYVNMDSRKPIFEAILDALTRSDVNMIGVYGLGGVGKTTLVKEIARKMLADGAFKQVPLITVSKDLNLEVIQKKLADELNLELDATVGKKGRAKLLWDKLKNGQKYLVVLDDVWEKVDLKEIGIPIADGTTGCKVVLTSRKEDLLRRTMKVDSNFRIEELLEEEAWTLFKNKVGNSIESRQEIISLAYDVCKRCKGLPVAINALGGALEGKPDHAWRDALAKLDRYMPEEIEDIDQSIWASLKLSYDMLSSDARSCFLLCCLFPEDAAIPITELTRHYVARSLLSCTFDEARDAVCTIVDALKSASMLSTSDHENVVTIHDVIRDVGISIARKEEAFLVDHGAVHWPRNPTNGPSYLGISLNLKNMKELPNGLVYPRLHTLMVHNSKLSNLEIPYNFFNGMTQLTELTFTRMSMRRLPSSLAKLTNLWMLNLNGCELADIAILEDLKSNLEVLSLRNSIIETLPPEIGLLTSLRLLDLEDCEKLMVIPRGVISNLTKLEELYFQKKVNHYDEQKDKSISWNMSLEELRWSLANGQLTTLHIHIPDVTLFPNEGLKFDKLKRFRISVGSRFSKFFYKEIPGTKVLKHEGSSLRNELIPLVENADALHLNGIRGLKKLLHDREGFIDLKYLEVISCDDDLEYLLGEPKSSVQSHVLHPFNNLTFLSINECKLKYLFSPTTARGLVHLEQLKVISCEIMEEIVGCEGQNDENELIFSKLKMLNLDHLPNLISFYAKKENMSTSMGSSSPRAQPLFSEKVIFPILEELNVQALGSIEEIWDKQSPSLNEKMVSFSQLRKISVGWCKKLMNLVPSNILHRLRNLQSLSISTCPYIEFVVFKNIEEEEEAANDSTFIIPQLRYLFIYSMESLKSFYSSSTTSNAQSLFNHQVMFPILEYLSVGKLSSIEEIWDKQSPSMNEKTVSFSQLRKFSVEGCKKLTNLVPSNMLPRLQNLQSLDIWNCPNIQVLVFKNGKDEEEEAADDETLIIPQLRNLCMYGMESLKSFYSSSTTSNAQSFFNHQVIFPVLEKLSILGMGSIEIWNKQSIAVFEAQGSFYQLKQVKVKRCNKLMHVYPSKMHQVLKNLKELKVEDCETMEGIVGFEDGLINEACISKVTRLELCNLPNLVSFCTKLGKAGTSEGNSTIHAQPLFNHQVIFPVLEKLSILGVGNIEIWDKQSIAVFEAQGSFCQLIDLDVRNCDNLMHVYPSKMHHVLKNLESLEVRGCETMEGIVGFEDGLINEVCFSKVTKLKLWDLPYLVSFYTKLGKAGTSEGNSTIHAQPLFNEKVILPVLEELEVVGLDSIEEIWDKQSPSLKEKTVPFSQLTKISVTRCKKLMYLVPSNILRQLRNLQSLSIVYCPCIQFVVFKNGKEEQEAANDSTLIIPQLSNLTINHMENLKSFYSSSTSSNGQSLFNHQVIFPALEDLIIDYVPEIKEIWDKKPLSKYKNDVESFCKLNSVTIYHCDQLEYVFPSYMLPQLQNLVELCLFHCKEIKVIISNKLKEKEATNNHIILFPQLREVSFGRLPKLKSFYTRTQIFFSHKDTFPLLVDTKIDLDADLEFLEDGDRGKD